MKFKRIGHYKYRLLEDVLFVTPIRTEPYTYTVERDESSRWLILRPYGDLLILKDYAWDGASGPTMDTKSIMRGALAHDGLYQLMREGGPTTILPEVGRQVAQEDVQRGWNDVDPRLVGLPGGADLRKGSGELTVYDYAWLVVVSVMVALAGAYWIWTIL